MGMAEYINREAVRNELYDADAITMRGVAILNNFPSADAVEVVHGRWEKYTDDKFMGYGADGRIRYRKVYSYKCSKCWNYTAVKHKYCPNCGAKMDGDGNG